MKYSCTLIVVDDIERSKKFYFDTLGLTVLFDLGENAMLSDGIALQTKGSWIKLIDGIPEEISYRGNDSELYFEEDDFDTFYNKLKTIPDVMYVHGVIEHDWGQRVVRIYDPDFHIIEIGESMTTVCRRFLDSGMSVEETAKRTTFPVVFVRACIKDNDKK